MYGYYSILFCNQEQVMIAWVELFIFASVLKEFNFHYFINLTWPTFTAASTVQFAVVILLEKTRFQEIKVYFCLKNAKKKETGATGVNLGKHWKTIDSFCFPPSPKTIELFEKALPFPENHWSVWKTSPRPLPLWPGRGQGRGPLHSMSPSVLSSWKAVSRQAFAFLRWI